MFEVPPAFSGFPQLVPLTLVTGGVGGVVALPTASDGSGVPVSLEDLWPAKLGDAVTDAAVEEDGGSRCLLECFLSFWPPPS